MEALGTVASIIAVTTVALRSSTTVYETIRGIKNGPEEVKELASEVQQLCHLLRQVAKMSKKIDDRDGTSMSELQSVIDKCRQNLDDFHKRFDKFEISSNERKLTKAWTRAKLVVQKEDFRRMSRIVSHYVNVLGVHVNLIGREMDDHHKVELARSTLQTSAASQLLRQNSGMLMEIGNSLSAVGNGLARQDTQRGMEMTMIKNSHQAVKCLWGRLNDLASMSKSQSESLLEKFEKLQSQIEELKTLPGHAPTAYSGKLEQGAENRKLADKYRIIELSESIKRLCSLASQPRSTVFSHEAQCIISDVEKILIFVSESPKLTETNESRKRKNDQTVDAEAIEASGKSQLRLDIGKMRGLLTSSEHVSLNQRASSSVDFSLEDRSHRQTKNQCYATELGLVSVQVKRRRLLKNAESQDDISIDGVNQQVENVFEGTVSLIPERDICRTKISTSFLQKWTVNGYFSLKPTLTFCAIIPDNSHIFTLTREGDLKGMINHIQQGRASLTDCDSKGRTLLNYALHNYRLEVSKFLINEGADVDAIEPPLSDNEDIINDDDYKLLPHVERISKFQWDDDFDKTRFDMIWRFRRLLLEAGADPTNHDSRPDSPNFALIYLDSLKNIFDMSADFIDLEARLDDIDNTPLLLCTSGMKSGVSPQCVKFLLDRGADVTARDAYGNTGLHNVLRSAQWRSGGSISKHKASSATSVACRYSTAVKKSLVHLIQAGADVCARTNIGNSVSDIAYNTDFRNSPPYFGDVWEEALSVCGYDATWFREDFCRRKHAVVGDLCPCWRPGRRYNFNETNFTDSTDEKLDVSYQYFKSYEPDVEDFQDDEPNSQGHKLNLGAYVPDERSHQDTERPFKALMQDSNLSSLLHHPTSLNPAWIDPAPHSHGTEQTMQEVNIWNQAEREPGEENMNLPRNGSPWGEDLPDADVGWGWDSNSMPQFASSISPWIREVEDGGGMEN